MSIPSVPREDTHVAGCSCCTGLPSQRQSSLRSEISALASTPSESKVCVAKPGASKTFKKSPAQIPTSCKGPFLVHPCPKRMTTVSSVDRHRLF
eukprot:920567-Amphidinium_carterae.1